jgi:hypothetical protein
MRCTVYGEELNERFDVRTQGKSLVRSLGSVRGAAGAMMQRVVLSQP